MKIVMIWVIISVHPGHAGESVDWGAVESQHHRFKFSTLVQHWAYHPLSLITTLSCLSALFAAVPLCRAFQSTAAKWLISRAVVVYSVTGPRGLWWLKDVPFSLCLNNQSEIKHNPWGFYYRCLTCCQIMHIHEYFDFRVWLSEKHFVFLCYCIWQLHITKQLFKSMGKQYINIVVILYNVSFCQSFYSRFHTI